MTYCSIFHHHNTLNSNHYTKTVYILTLHHHNFKSYINLKTLCHANSPGYHMHRLLQLDIKLRSTNRRICNETTTHTARKTSFVTHKLHILPQNTQDKYLYVTEGHTTLLPWTWNAVKVTCKYNCCAEQC